jgi:hypothetical protein
MSVEITDAEPQSNPSMSRTNLALPTPDPQTQADGFPY